MSLAAAQARSVRQVSANDSKKEAGLAVKAQGFREHWPCQASTTFFKVFEILLILDFVEAVAKLRDGIHGGYWRCSEKSRTQGLSDFEHSALTLLSVTFFICKNEDN